MIFLVSFVVFCLLIWYLTEGQKTAGIKRNGIKATGVIINNREFQGSYPDSEQLGGNINTPMIRFTIEDGSEITGKPVTGFISQHEVQVPSYINVIYDPKQPSKFIIDTD
jgi:hypothetical protein